MGLQLCCIIFADAVARDNDDLHSNCFVFADEEEEEEDEEEEYSSEEEEAA